MSVAEARPESTISGRVVASRGRWTDDGSRIVTEATIETANGSQVTVSQLGGSADGLTMRTFPGDAPLGVGDQVALTTTLLPTERGTSVHAVTRVIANARANFVRSGVTKGGNPLYWESGCATLVIDAAGTNQIAAEQEFTLVKQTVDYWNQSVASCSYMRIELEESRTVEVGKDFVNVLKFRDTDWCRPARANDPMRCYSPSAAGLTTVVFIDDATSPRDGAIVDADVELNGVNFSVSDNNTSLGTAPCLSDLRNTLTHELGHFLGLEHTCRTPTDPERLDNNGVAVPQCSMTESVVVKEATMFNFQDCGETKKQTLEQDDIAGVCGIYPKSINPGECKAAQSSVGNCATSRGPSGWLWLGLTYVALCFRRKRPM